ncbi:MAG: amidohydrolase family protein [Candidatus Pacebacteria bacterium]|nr:amidohydrolase family protein [Candidatus Paceibacterota bacterium]
MVLIKQAQIIDGSGQKAFRADILINDGKISAIGSFPHKKADVIINALGLDAVPGFIDVNTDSDHHLSLFTNPSQKDFVHQGVSTIIGGQCGASLAPLMYGSLASIKEWANTDLVNVDWRGVKEFFNILRKINLEIRFETLVGHSTVRMDVAGGETRDLTESELQVFSKILEDSLNEGALGMSTGLGHIYGRRTPYSEIKLLVNLVAKHGKVYTTHLRDEGVGLLKSIEETVAVAHDTGAKTVISHLRPIRGFENNFEQAIELIDKNLVNANVYFDVNPFETSLIPLYSLLPSWIQGDKAETLLEYLKKDEIRGKIMQEVAGKKLEDLVVVSARNNDHLVGKSLKEIAGSKEKNVAETVLELMEATRFVATLASKNLDAPLLDKALFHPRALIGSNSASLPENTKKMRLERATSTFLKFLEISKEHNIPREEAIKRITFIPAQVFGLKNRGLIKEGYLADIVLLKDQTVKGVVLNGKYVVNNG